MDSPALCPSGIGCGSLNPQASSGASLPRHGLKTQSVPSMKPEEKIRPICPPTQSGKSVYFCGTSPIEGVAATPQGERERKVKHFSLGPPRGSTPRGTPSGRFFGDFLIGEKVTRVQGGAPAGGCRDYQSRKNPRGRRGGAPALGGCGGWRPPLRGAGAKSDDLLLRGRSPLASGSAGTSL